MIFVVVPAYNEEKAIGRVIRGLFERGYKKVIVVDDGSSDNTGSVAKDAGAIVARHPVNRGQGAALQTGNELALKYGAEIIVHFDADGQFNPDDISGAVRLMNEKKLDIILGSRFLDNRSKIPYFKKKFMLPLARWATGLIAGIKLSDAHNGFRILNRKAAEAIKITQDGMAHNSEIIAKIKSRGLKFSEYPVEVVYHEYGQGIGGGVKIIVDLIFSKLFG